MNKTFKMLSVALATILAAGFISCTKEDNEPATIDEQGGKSYVTLSINIPNRGDATRGDVDDNGNHEEGTADEYAVKMAYLYLFNNGTFQKRIDMDFSGVTSTENTTTLVRTFTKTEEVVGLDIADYTTYVLVNEAISAAAPTEAELKAAQLKEMTANYSSVPSTGLAMSSRTDAGVMSDILSIDGTNIDEEHAAEVSFTIERANGKIQLAASAQENTSGDVNEYVVYWDTTATGRQHPIATVNLVNYKLVNLAKHDYAFRHVGDYDAVADLKGDTTSFGIISDYSTSPTEPYNPYLIVPDYAGYTATNTKTRTFLFDADYAAYPTSTDMTTISYPYENAMYYDQQKEGYCTGVIFKATVTPDSLLTWNTTDTKLDTLTGTNISLTDVSRVLYYGGRFYSSVTALQAQTNSFTTIDDSSTDGKIDSLGVTVLPVTSGVINCYYKYWIKHLDNKNDNELGVMEYSIVRNNVYKLKVLDIYSIGDGSDSTDPDNPVESKKYYIKVNLNIKPWIIRSNEEIHLG
jgi:hypothetical protein